MQDYASNRPDRVKHRKLLARCLDIRIWTAAKFLANRSAVRDIRGKRGLLDASFREPRERYRQISFAPLPRTNLYREVREIRERPA